MFVSLKNRFFLLFLISIISTTMLPSFSVEAHRIGSSHYSIGKSYKVPYKKNHSNFNNNVHRHESKKIINSNKKDNLFSKILRSVIIGFGLSTLLAHFGLSSFFINLISGVIISFLVLSSIYCILRYFFAKNSEAVYGKGRRSFYENNYTYTSSDSDETNSYYISSLVKNLNVVEFSEQAKRCFIYIQELWNNGDIESLKGYLTDEMISAIENELKYRGYSREVQVLSLDHEFLNIDYDKSNNYVLANIRFFGSIKENHDLASTSFDEIWIFQKSYSSGWLLAGIQKDLNS